jgi:hypothetical protein
VRTFDDEVIRCIRRWSRKLAASSNYVLDPKDLAGVCGLRAADTRVWEKLRQIYLDPELTRGGLRGLRAYIGRLCRNTYTNELAKKFAAKRCETIRMVSLEFDYTPDEEEAFTLLDLITADDTEAFSLRDVQEFLDPEEFKIVLDLMADTSIREMAKDSSQSKSSMGRKVQQTASKLKVWLEKVQATPQPRYINPKNRIMGGRTLRPDRISPENARCWNDSLIIRPFYVCSHLYPAANDLGTVDVYQSFDLAGAIPQSDQHGLCRQCWEMYWTKTSERLASEILRLESDLALEDAILRFADEIGSAALGTK